MNIDNKINQNTNISSKNVQENQEHRRRSPSKSSKEVKTIYAGDLNITGNSIEAKKAMAQKNALKAILDTFKKELATDGFVSDLVDKKNEYAKTMDNASKEVLNIRKLKQELKDTYGIQDDSPEQKNLELLCKKIYSNEELTKEELEQLNNMGPLTEYQEAALRYEVMEQEWLNVIDKASQGTVGTSQSITAISLARLKSHPMTDAMKQAAKIMEDASKEVISTIIKQAKENEDAELEEIEEKAKQQQEQLEKLNPPTKEDKELAKLTAKSIDHLQLLNEIKQFAQEQNLTDEEIKGILIDEEL